MRFRDYRASRTANRTKASAERFKQLNADPKFNPLVTLTPQQRNDYDALKNVGYTRDEAFAAIGLPPPGMKAT